MLRFRHWHPALAQAAHSAAVVSSVPVYHTVNERQQQCRTESVASYEERRSPGGAIHGGLTGGLIGNNIGRGNGRTAYNAFGVVNGAHGRGPCRRPGSQRKVSMSATRSRASLATNNAACPSGKTNRTSALVVIVTMTAIGNADRQAFTPPAGRLRAAFFSGGECAAGTPR